MIFSLVKLAFICVVLGLWSEFINWMTSFFGLLGPFIGAFVPIALLIINNSEDLSKSSIKGILIVSAVLSILLMLFTMWNKDYI